VVNDGVEEGDVIEFVVEEGFAEGRALRELESFGGTRKVICVYPAITGPTYISIEHAALLVGSNKREVPYKNTTSPPPVILR